MLRSDPKLFQDNHLRYPIYDLNLPFSEYIVECKKLIASTRMDLDPNPEKVIDANAPFEFFPAEKNPTTGALLIHGLLDCPFVMRDVGRELQNQGLLARGLLLPGHGTVPGDLLDIKAEQWIQAVKYGMTQMNKDVDKVYLVGFSTGAALIVHAMLSELADTSKVAGIILMSPAIKIRSRLDFTTGCYPFLGKFWQRASWLHLEKEIDYTRYQSLPFNAAYQVFRLTRMIKKINHGQTIQKPMQMILSSGDTTISANACIEFFNKNTNPHNRLLLYSDKKFKTKNENTILRNAVYPELRIRHLSHISIPISPKNPHYGRNGDYQYASRVDDEKNKNVIYGALNKLQIMMFQLLLKAQIIVEQHQRLTFNPDFEFMMQEITSFVCSSASHQSPTSPRQCKQQNLQH